MEDTPGLTDFRWRVAEAIAWCTGRGAAADPGDVFWSPALRPARISARLPYAALTAAYDLPYGQRGPLVDERVGLTRSPTAERPAIVAELAALRARALRTESCYPDAPAGDLAGGRLVVFFPDATLSCGAAEDATRGFFDVDNMPGWDTWVWYVPDAGDDESSYGSYLLSWAPPPLVDLVDDGVAVNPEVCIGWAEDWVEDQTGDFLRRLRAAGFTWPR